MTEVSFPTNVTVIPEGGGSIEAGERPQMLENYLTEVGPDELIEGGNYWVAIEVGGDYKNGSTETIGNIAIPITYMGHKSCMRRVTGTWLNINVGWIQSNFGSKYTLPHPSFRTEIMIVIIDGTDCKLKPGSERVFPQAKRFYKLSEGITLDYEKEPKKNHPVLRFDLNPSLSTVHAV